VKPDAAAASLEMLRHARAELNVPLVAIGGITLQNGRQLLEAGADALAVISALFSVPDIEDAARRFSKLNFN
jgi:thiamine-phosphate pyrophosphorylase